MLGTRGLRQFLVEQLVFVLLVVELVKFVELVQFLLVQFLLVQLFIFKLFIFQHFVELLVEQFLEQLQLVEFLLGRPD